MLSSHNKVELPCIFLDTLHGFIEEHSEKSRVILINEVQFFGEELVDVVCRLVDVLGKRVYLFGLDGDYRRKPFGHILSLIPKCDKIEKLSALCMKCGNGELAIFSQRISSPDSPEEQVLIGSEDKYIPVCRKCYF